MCIRDSHGVQRHAVFVAQGHVLLQRPVFGAVVEDGRPAHIFRVCAPAQGQLHRFLFRSPDVGDALGLHHGVGHAAEVFIT